MKKVLVPSVRFKGFSEEWKEEKFGELLFRINEKGYEFLETLTASKSGEMLKRKSINYHIQVAKESLKNYNRVLKNDFVLHLSTYESGLAYSKEIGITSPAYDVLRFFDKNNNDPIFFKYVFSNKKFINSLVPFTYGLRQGKSINLVELNKSLIEKTNISEQQKIGKLLDHISNLIILEQLKLNKLKQLKQTLLQKMFPEANSKVPRIRFRGFEGEWEEERISNILTYVQPWKYLTKKKNFDMLGDIPVLTANKSLLLGYSVEDNYYNKECIIFDDFTQDFKHINYPFLLKSSAIKILIPNNNYSISFIFFLFQSLRFESQGHARHYISYVQKKIIRLPSTNEANKIIKLLDNITNLLDLYNSKLNKLKQIKEALLQKMFV
ncbi:restriction endonuclease subunit S [Mycoplasmopsis felis]|uniref:restriction endonuclease subunit S n=1 Tax=Mycoplasmopsis felis TaxID=33923 RepID=UPI002AFF1E1E|nr:restriction endonuclease subunit S [Mycoplasmopsis felis]WQQ03973.1 restriction endonuclease subunit S [Mycoplasmopsis felis]